MGALTHHRARDPGLSHQRWMRAYDRSEAILHGSRDVTKLDEGISDDRFRSLGSARR